MKSKYQISARAGILYATTRLNSRLAENEITAGTDSAAGRKALRFRFRRKRIR
jgi:hypothetical protein